MYLIDRKILLVALSVVLLLASKSSEAVSGEDDSLRTEMASTIERCNELIARGSMSSVDSALVMLDTLAESILAVFGGGDSLLANVHYIASRCYLLRADYDHAQVASNRAIEIWSTAPDEHLLQIVRGLDIVAECGKRKGDLILWEEVCERRFALFTHLSVPLSPRVRQQKVSALIDRGMLRLRQGRFDEALGDYNEGIELVGAGVIDSSQLLLRLTGCIGVLFASQGKYAEAEEYMLKCLELKRTLYPARHLQILSSYIGVSNVIVHQGDPMRALQWTDSAQALAEELHTSNTMLSSLYRTKAKIFLALDSLQLAVNNAERAVQVNLSSSSYSTDRLMWSLHDAGLTAFFAGKIDLGVNRFNELVTRRRTFLNTVFRYASEDQKLAYLWAYPPIESRFLSGAVEYPGPTINRSVMNMVLAGKGLAIEAMAADQAAAICSADPLLDSLLADRRESCSEIARLSLYDRSGDESTLERLEELYTHKELVEKQLGSFCSRLRIDKDEDTLLASAVASKLPQRSVLLEFVKFLRDDLSRPYEPDTPPGDYYYAVMTLTPSDEVTLIDLGPASTIDKSIAELQSAMTDVLRQHLSGRSETSIDLFNQVSAELYTLLIAPLEETLIGAQEVYIAADGALCLLPFGTLTNDGKRYLIEDYRFLYLTSGRDLLREHRLTNSRTAVVMADPDYMIDPATLPTFTMQPTSAYASRGNTEAPECLASMFSPLPMTHQEGSIVARLLDRVGGMDVSYLEADHASEGALKSLQQAPRVLHIATHGYFCPEANRSTLSSPLLRSGLLFAGANRTIGQMSDNRVGDEDGILTALEASGLNLVGTDLVVLSACQTAVGEVSTGEGVFGLRRAFQNAGARSLIMSMFAVPDASTVTLMERFYSNWLSGQSKSAALRNASLSILNERRERGASDHPLFWGGFVLVGDPN
jgi:CHAT domain-containing protein/tetratricopeptide (TPR) repeat protein